MKKIILSVAMALFGYYAYAQDYLPLTAGSTNPLTGALYITHPTLGTGNGIVLKTGGDPTWFLGTSATTASDNFEIYNESLSSSAIYINQNNFVGLGYTTDPGTDNKLAVNGTSYFDGSVLIGEASPANTTYKLNVNGSARASEVVVNTSGADFVFDKKYSLPKLSNIKVYIDANHHLPEIPSAKEMQANGLGLGEMNKKLLQKVEELTLYLIDKDKELTEQQKQITALKKQVKGITKQLHKNDRNF